MPRYFFEFEDGGNVTASTGGKFPEENAAGEAAKQLASQIE
jgi:hypothetical protein